MRFSLKFTTAAFLLNAALIRAVPLPSSENEAIEARDGDLEARYTKQECEAGCTPFGLQGAAWTQSPPSGNLKARDGELVARSKKPKKPKKAMNEGMQSR